MNNAIVALLLMQIWLMIAVVLPWPRKSNAAFIHSCLWFAIWVYLVLR